MEQRGLNQQTCVYWATYFGVLAACIPHAHLLRDDSAKQNAQLQTTNATLVEFPPRAYDATQQDHSTTALDRIGVGSLITQENGVHLDRNCNNLKYLT